MRFIFHVLVSVLVVSGQTSALAQQATSGKQESILAMSAIEDAGGTTQAELDLPVLRMLERRSVELLERKMRDYLRSQGQSDQMPKLQAESHYVEKGGMKLAVIRIRSAKTVNQVFIYGIKSSSFLRVACVRTANFEQSIPLFYGPCGEKVREVFGVSIGPR
jgi:hypothetical protein